ncbi:MAG: phosphomannomutase/phosphoglucomutase [Anaerolineae bacterium]|nr:phosphomannomutase/phosphoglucomutase [Anaerolineae bacterium]MCZ7553700.1 phosphomannomutase/phosphoglucomutase [Anaerolineales bacterium]
MQVDESIFKAYDIRGVYPEQLDERVAYRIGRAFAALLAAPRVIVGRDMRLSGAALQRALVQGLADQGADVYDIGMVSTDQYYFACGRWQLPGVMVTASHNPKEYNGFKLVRRMPYLLSGDEGIQDIRRLVQADEFPPAARSGRVERVDIRDEFSAEILALVDVAALKPLKVVADTANGMVGPILQQIYAKLPVELVGLYLEPDGSLPNHGLDPLQLWNRAELQRRVIEARADVGFAFDGDGDRFFAIDNRGLFVAGDYLTAILARYLLEKRPGAKIIYDVRASWAVPDEIRAAGGVPVMERVGHAFIKRRMADEGALFAGEVTGHYYFQDFFSADSGILPSLILLELLSRRGVKLSQILKPLEDRYFITGEINTRVDNVQRRIEMLAERFQDGEQSQMDGISVRYPTWHFNVRPSNTEPLLRLNLESIQSPYEMTQRRTEVLDLIRGKLR